VVYGSEIERFQEIVVCGLRDASIHTALRCARKRAESIVDYPFHYAESLPRCLERVAGFRFLCISVLCRFPFLSNAGIELFSITGRRTKSICPRENEADESNIEEALEEPFPASDPPNWTLGREEDDE
jgi:hypothetical protein